MIFKHLFRSKHQNPNPQVRIQAIENLSKQDPEQKSILHELAFNDSDVNVSLAALQKLDSFVLWYKMAEIAKNERVQKRSKKVVEDALLTEDNNTLDAIEKRKFVLECRDNRLLEKLLLQAWVQQDIELAMQLLQKLDKPQLQEKLLIESQNESLQLAILSMLEDGVQQRKLLNRLLKKNCSENIQTESKKCLDTWLRAESLPLEVEQKVKMVLSRLLALKDSSDLSIIQTQQQALDAEYQTLANDFNCFPALKKQEIEQKFSDISKKVNSTLAVLEPQWLAQQADVELQTKIETLTKSVKQTLTQISEQLGLRMSELTEVESTKFSQDITSQGHALQALIGLLPVGKSTEHKRLEKLHQDLLSSQCTLDNLPKLKESIEVAEQVIEKFSALALPNDQSQIEAAQDFARELKQQWRDTIAEHKVYIPAVLIEKWNKRNKEWQKALKELQTQISADVSRCRNKIRAVDSLVNQGKFKAAMGLYQKVKVWFEALPEKQQAQLDKAFKSTKEQIENLQDWQEYIAAPRKPALFKEVEALLEMPLPIKEQAKAVKSLRAQWNSLGKLDTESDQALNEAFDQAVEKAFEPCRQHYDKQQKEREQNLLSKQQVLNDLAQLNSANIATSELAKTQRHLQQKWKKIGEVDYKLRSELYDQYQKLNAPLRDKVNQFYQDNQEQKQTLLDKALKLIELESIDDAIEQVKTLQQQWKMIEHAGRKAEAELWPAFRRANDQVFSKRTEVSQLQEQATKLAIDEAKDNVSQMEVLLKEAKDKASIQVALQATFDIKKLLSSLPVNEQRVVERKIQSLVEQQDKKLALLKKEHKEQQFRDIFYILQNWNDESELSEQINELPKPWQACFINSIEGINRQELVIKIEILTNTDSPQADSDLRKNIQMQLMAQKLQTGEALNVDVLLKNWISAGKLNEEHKVLLPRLEKIFISES